jgi:hypothetical protein
MLQRWGRRTQECNSGAGALALLHGGIEQKGATWGGFTPGRLLAGEEGSSTSSSSHVMRWVLGAAGMVLAVKTAAVHCLHARKYCSYAEALLYTRRAAVFLVATPQ